MLVLHKASQDDIFAEVNAWCDNEDPPDMEHWSVENGFHIVWFYSLVDGF